MTKQRLKAVLAAVLLTCSSMSAWGQATNSCMDADWQPWVRAKSKLITAEGRVVDESDPRRITTSEGQSYGLFMALVHNDTTLFRKLLHWTEMHLAGGDLGKQLPAWLWGRDDEGKWGVLDSNSASDSDLWIAYSLLEAGRLWNEVGYTLLANELLSHIAKSEVTTLDDLGVVLLPGEKGFRHDGRTRLNPSYLPPQVAKRIAEHVGRPPWTDLADNTSDFLRRTSPIGIAPDWITWTNGRFEAASDMEKQGSYDAIRVYLWIGMLDDGAEEAPALKTHFRAIERYVDKSGRVAERINWMTGEADSRASYGFSAALLPLLQSSAKYKNLLQYVQDVGGQETGYYNTMLALFGLAWDQERYRFSADGKLLPSWGACQ